MDGCGLGEGVMVGTNFVIMHALSSLLMFSREGLSELVVLQVHFRGPRKTLAGSSLRCVLLLLHTTKALKLSSFDDSESSQLQVSFQ